MVLCPSWGGDAMDKRSVPVLFAGLAAVGGCSAAPEPTTDSVDLRVQQEVRAASYTGSFWSDFSAAGCSIVSKTAPFECAPQAGYPPGSLCTWDTASCSSDF